jgi:N-acetylglucosamine-6-phosphate deacetylase
MIELAKKEMGDKLFLITDAVTRSNQGAYQHVFTGDRYTMPDGTLSGSCLSMLKAVENCVNHVNIPIDEALRMASTYPAKLIKDTKHGYLKTGYAADILVFDKNLQFQKTYFSGILENNLIN